MMATDNKLNQLTVLFADDDEMVRDVARTMLTRSGFKVLLARNGREAVDMFCENPLGISLIILDIMMPEMNGKEALLSIRQIKPDAKILMSSGFDEESVSISKKDTGFAYIQKPYMFNALMDKIRMLLNPSGIPNSMSPTNN